MHFDAGFLLFRLGYWADYEEWITVNNPKFWATKLTIPHFVMLCNFNDKKPLNFLEWETLKNLRKVEISMLWESLYILPPWPTP